MTATALDAASRPAWVDGAANQSRLAFGLAVTELAGRDQRVIAVSADTLDLIGLRAMIEAHIPLK